MIRNFIRDQYSIISKVVGSITSLFNIQRYGLKGCESDDCYDYNLIKFELLQWQLVKEDTSYIPIPPLINNHIYWGYFTDDPYNIIIASGTNSLQYDKVFINSISIYQELNFSGSANDKYLVLKEPIEALVKTQWYNTSFNFGTIPDQVFRAPIIYDGYRYYVSRNPVFLPIGSTKISFQ